MYGRVIWVARNASPKMAKIRRTLGSDRTPLTAPNASDTTEPSGMTVGRTSCDPKVTSRAVPIESSADTANTADSDQPRPSTIRPPSAGPTANPTGPEAPKMAMVTPSRRERRDVADAGQHHARVAELEADQQHRQGQLPRFARQRHDRRRPRPPRASCGR